MALFYIDNINCYSPQCNVPVYSTQRLLSETRVYPKARVAATERYFINISHLWKVNIGIHSCVFTDVNRKRCCDVSSSASKCTREGTWVIQYLNLYIIQYRYLSRL